MLEQSAGRLQELLELKEARLHELSKQQAIQGVNTPVHITLEINSLRDDIVVLKEALQKDVKFK